MYDAVVVGLGGVGSFALRSLGRSGAKVLGIERFALGHTQGSSHGKSRIYRQAYFEHPSYVPWIQYSLDVFRELPPDVMTECGCLLIEPQTSDDLPPLLAASKLSADTHGLEVEYLPNDALRARYPHFRVEPNMVGLLEPKGAGLMRPELVMAAAIRDARACDSVTVYEHTKVLGFESKTDDKGATVVEVSLERDGVQSTIVTRALLVSAGAYTGELLPEWAQHLTVTRQVQGWVDVRQLPHEPESYQDLPAFLMVTPKWPLSIYGLPCDRQSDEPYWIKVAAHCRPSVLPYPINNPKTVTEEEREEAQQVARIFLNADKDDWALTSVMPCMYTMTKDSHYMIGCPRPGVFSVAGLSGHGFKMTPALGQMMADYALGEDLTKWELGFCDPKRFD